MVLLLLVAIVPRDKRGVSSSGSLSLWKLLSFLSGFSAVHAVIIGDQKPLCPAIQRTSVLYQYYYCLAAPNYSYILERIMEMQCYYSETAHSQMQQETEITIDASHYHIL